MYNKAINIKWDTTDEDRIKECGDTLELPTEVDLPIGIAELEDEEANYESVNNYLSDKYGWLVEDYDLVKAEPLSDGELLDLLYAELEKEQSTYDMGYNMAELLREHKQG